MGGYLLRRVPLRRDPINEFASRGGKGVNNMPPVKSIKLSIICGAVLGASIVCSTAFAQSPTPVPQDQERGQTSYMKVDITEPFSTIMARMTAAKPGIEKEHTDL
ncbi:MAG TPA: hypothetical protein VN857_07235, partial [Chthoniobacterales bacterium]|nr:hypothetical protein [Chthoniobacterales bacterium]